MLGGGDGVALLTLNSMVFGAPKHLMEIDKQTNKRCVGTGGALDAGSQSHVLILRINNVVLSN